MEYYVIFYTNDCIMEKFRILSYSIFRITEMEATMHNLFIVDGKWEMKTNWKLDECCIQTVVTVIFPTNWQHCLATYVFTMVGTD